VTRGRVPGLDLPAREVHLWAFGLDLRGAALARLEALLSDDESARAATLRSARQRARFVAGRGTLRRLLGRYAAGDPARIRFRYTDLGKPELEGDGALHFSLSHSGGLAVCAVSRGRLVGVDVERVRDGLDGVGIAERFFAPGEARRLRRLPTRTRRAAFFRCWTRKEAYQKALGKGVFAGLGAFEVTVGARCEPRLVRVDGQPDEPRRWRLRDLTPCAGYVGAVIAEGGDWRARWLRRCRPPRRDAPPSRS